MHNNFFFLQRLARELNESIVGMTFGACFTQTKGELVMGFYRERDELWIRAVISPAHQLLAFSDSFHRAKKNNVVLFEDALGKQVEQVSMMENERIMVVHLTGQMKIALKLFGVRPNALHIIDDKVMDVFHKRFDDELDKFFIQLGQPLPQTKEAFFDYGTMNCFPTLGKDIHAYLREKDLPI